MKEELNQFVCMGTIRRKDNYYIDYNLDDEEYMFEVVNNNNYFEVLVDKDIYRKYEEGQVIGFKAKLFLKGGRVKIKAYEVLGV